MEQLLSSYVCSTSMTLGKLERCSYTGKGRELKAELKYFFPENLPDGACSSCQNVDKIFDWNKPWHDLEIEL